MPPEKLIQDIERNAIMNNKLRKILVLTLSCVALNGTLSNIAYADFDPKEEAREREAAKRAAIERAKDLAATARQYRQMLVKPPYNENAAKVAAMSDAEVRAYYPRRHKEFIADQKAKAEEASRKGVQEMRAKLDSLTPEQRAMIERASGQSVDQLTNPPKQGR
jgi:hypothetical protein